MEQMTLSPSRSTPEVRFDPEANVLAIRGQSYPENAFAFYEPLLKWVDLYLLQLNSDSRVEIELQLPYINTTSTKCFVMLLEKLDQAHLAGKKIEVLWYYDEENESELECAEDFKEDLSLPFHILPKAAQ
ncbi:DUF1987 domain-containing protein [Cohnella faecalis]|uniref:DUF1987 domain-containing protein n=1 Tax=Cohnella faecalis TaxID=2315694 RepID=A0A398CLU2_9BACL|nr:DUF1987 domain-containing protein [Cohnella faecalis]